MHTQSLCLIFGNDLKFYFVIFFSHIEKRIPSVKKKRCHNCLKSNLDRLVHNQICDSIIFSNVLKCYCVSKHKDIRELSRLIIHESCIFFFYLFINQLVDSKIVFICQASYIFCATNLQSE